MRGIGSGARGIGSGSCGVRERRTCEEVAGARGEAVAVGAEVREELRLQPGVRQAVRAAELRELRLQLFVEVDRTDTWMGFHFAANGSVAALLLL